ncbi:hypothetical protein, partial [Streptomyces sp. SID1034]|uniref:hypothetical protein n=1 Tax=Streptomyces sp. SID1034 TaxID=2690248 RepID=UPI001F2F28B0
VNTGSIKAHRASDTSLRYGRRVLTIRQRPTIASSHKNIPNHQLPRSDALLAASAPYPLVLITIVVMVVLISRPDPSAGTTCGAILLATAG